MTRASYRGDDDALLARILTLRDDVLERKSRLLPSFWRHLHPQARSALEALEAQLSPVLAGEASALDRVQQAELLTRYRAALDEAIGAIPDLERHLAEYPERFPPVECPRASHFGFSEALTEGGLAQLAEETDRLVMTFLSHAEHVAHHHVERHAHRYDYWLTEIPFSLGFRVIVSNAGPSPYFRLAMPLRNGTPQVSLSPETWGHAITKALRIHRDAQIGDESFDSMFLIDAEQDDARFVLTRPVRRAVEKLSRFDVPYLFVGPGRAELMWSYEAEIAVLRRAHDVMRALRGVSLDIHLIRASDDSAADPSTT